ncbi:MAG: phospho-N-acetylmuramoyl-pentapeptide-transferase [Desulfarculales bacterium]|jgi:phospho-N-acetylmuramoyl-pentapeptide-transferase|nr:phospho-N-acetylmuramoyl-pentapeptide-transferase [Desulfarculales bacterium]
MLYSLLYPLRDDFGLFNVVRYLSFRTIASLLTALLICYLLGPWFIKKMRQLQMSQYIRDLGPKSHQAKAGTPTMGGVLILFSVLLSCLLWADWSNFFLLLCLGTTLSFGLVGFADDYRKKVARRNEGGLSGRVKMLLLLAVSLLTGILLYCHPGYETQLAIPFFKWIVPELGIGYIFLSVLILVGSTNAVNLTDGLDGLAAGPVAIAATTYLIMAYLAGNLIIARYLQIFYVPGAGEISVFLGAITGSVIGFLWYNTYPAQIFMGDTGSLSLGGALGISALCTKHEILLVLVGGLFVVEALSVILQVGFFKATRGRRIFRMAPLHHHFELKGWAEPKVIVRFWIISIVLALLAFSTLKLR